MISFIRCRSPIFVLIVGICIGCGSQSSVETVSDNSTVATGAKEAALANSDAATIIIDDTPAWKFRDLLGNDHDPFQADGAKAIVVVFVTTDCPIANYYQPTLSRMTDEYAPQGVPFFLCHSDPDIEQEAAIKHAEEFKTKATVILDGNQAIAKRLDAKVTPEAFLVDRVGKTLYRGRINDLYADYGKRRSAPRTNDLTDAIDALLAGEPIATAKTKAIGCYIPYPKPDKEKDTD